MSLSDFLDRILGQSQGAAPAKGGKTQAPTESLHVSGKDELDPSVTTSFAGILDDDELELLVPTHAPTLLDFLPKPGGPSRHRAAIPPAPRSASSSTSRTSSGGISSTLPTRLQTHLTAPTAVDSLKSLLASSRTNEDIQSELVEILGFEGDGLQLVEETLRPGAREYILSSLEDRGIHGSPSPSHKDKDKGINGYLPSSRLSVTAKTHIRDKKKTIDITDVIGSEEDIERRLREQLERPKAMFSADGPRIVEQEILPHVYTTGGGGMSAMSQGGRFALPEGTVREINDTFEEVIVPPNRPVPPKKTERPVKISELPPLARGCFPKYVTLNRMQSIVAPTAMDTNENMLICAPTGAGKTDVAIMAIIRVLAQHAQPKTSRPNDFVVDLNAFKIIYVAPMKALAAEITRKFSKRLAWLGVKVRELTGDMQLTRQEIHDTQVIVTTPEKWDVVTRKPTGEGELASKVKLLIIDEVHLLNDERGAVIETIVARTLRQVESSQSLIRIVGLSATLPNYIDVGDFLRVNRYQGLFFFDSSFRPVPLEQHFLGVAGKPRSQAAIRNMDRTVFDKVSELVREGHQVMVFVHARKETVKTAQKLVEMSQEEGMMSFFDTREHPQFGLYRREIGTSRNKELKELFDSGFGIHHAGMLRSDRNMVERMFEDNAIKVLCTTSTLAWGVNLPAHAVVIKGTQVYDSGRGAFVDLSVLDVLQIFGRAGRPGYETSGEGYICTTQDKLDHYLQAIMAQHPIESKFNSGMIDALNAEIALGTIANVQEAIQWLGYTYLFVRMRKEPLLYGMTHEEPKDDPQLGNKRNALIVQAARQLSAAKMIRFEEVSNSFVISDLGRIAAKYYLRYQSMEIFNAMFHPKMKNADLFAMLSQSTEFDQIQVRENEIPELTAILESDHCPMEVKGGVSNKHGKVNILLQAHISKVYLEDFALVSDAAYVAQNAARIIRALLEIALSRKWANNAILLIDLSKAIEQRMWPYEHPLAQINTLHKDTLHNLRQFADDTEVSDLREMDAEAIGELVHMNPTHGLAIKNAALMFPTVSIDYKLRPLSHDLLRINVHVKPRFTWNEKISGTAEPFYIWIEDEEKLNILSWRSILLRPSTTGLDLDFVIPYTDITSWTFSIMAASDRWLGSDDSRVVSLEGLIMPDPPPPSTQLLDIPYLKTSAFDDTSLHQSYGAYINTLNNIQSQTFWSIYHTSNNVLISAPTSSGKSFLGEVAILHAFRHNPDALVFVFVPHHRSVRETVMRLRSITPRSKHITVQPCLTEAEFESFGSTRRSVMVTTPSAFLRADQDSLADHIRQLSSIVLEDLHLLDQAYELAIAKILSVAKAGRIRIVGITSSINDPTDLANWLGVDSTSRYSFYPRDRSSPLVVSIKTFSIPHSATLLKSMVKPAYDIVKSSLANGGTIIFVPSRSACKSVAADLVTQSGTEMDLSGFLSAPREQVEPYLQGLRDQALYEPILHGIGYLNPNGTPSDLSLVLQLFPSGVLRVLIAPRESCWTLPLRAPTVVLLGTQYTVGSGNGDRQIVNYSSSELVKMQSLAVISAQHTAGEGRMFVMCEAEQSTIISRVLNDGLPLESSLPSLLVRESHPETISAFGRMFKTRQPPPPPQNNRRVPDLRKRDIMDFMGWTYFSWRVKSNPTYYDFHRGQENDELSRLVDKWIAHSGEEFGPTPSSLGSSSRVTSLAGSMKSNSVASKSKANTASVSLSMSREGSGASLGSAENKLVRGIGDIGEEVIGEATVGTTDGEALKTS